MKGLKDKSGIGMINGTKETYHLLTQSLTFVSHIEHSSGCRFLGPVYMRKNTSPARPGAERRGKFQPPFI